jgi:hypothetical protein
MKKLTMTHTIDIEDYINYDSFKTLDDIKTIKLVQVTTIGGKMTNSAHAEILDKDNNVIVSFKVAGLTVGTEIEDIII